MPAFGVTKWRATYSDNPLQIDVLGNLWVREYNRPSDRSSRWSVFDTSRRFLGVVEFPERFIPQDIGEDWVLGEHKDSMGVEHVSLYRLIKP